MTQQVKARIGGVWIQPTPHASVPAPYDRRETIAYYPLLTPQHVHEAVSSAHQAQPAWAQVPMPQKAAMLEHVATQLETHTGFFSQLIETETGKTPQEATDEVRKAIRSIRHVAHCAYQPTGYTLPSHHTGRTIHTRRIPLGVVGVITPWNFPLAVAAWKIAPALLAGNCVVFKPSQHTPLSGEHLVRLFEEAGLPPQVLHYATGEADGVGQALVQHPQVQAISFTGSTHTGRSIYAQVAARGARALCEMGGKNPLVVLDDADVFKAAHAAVQGAFGSAGQRCTATGLVIATPGIANTLLETVCNLTPTTPTGPCIHPTQHTSLLRSIQESTHMGAVLLRGGHALTQEPYTHGCFIAPTVLDHVTLQMPVGHAELFGPVLPFVRAENTAHALALANATPYGLSAALYTQNIHTAHHCTAQLQAGIVHINGPTMGSEAQAPFGGVKATSVGGRENGPSPLDFYTDVQTVYTDTWV
jgi:acyl-CoA reductase-like NAD-dependent aldehyde dehydrogenase